MRKIKLYSAMSLDYKIAKPDGDVSWLDEIPNPQGSDYGYHQFFNSIDTTLMGNKTYQQILDFDIEFPYKGKDNYVLTTNENLTQDENVTFISAKVPEFIRDLKKSEGRDIWLVGGGQINTLFLEMGLIDELLLFIMPVVLGGGIELLEGNKGFHDLKLTNFVVYESGVINVNYEIPKITKA